MFLEVGVTEHKHIEIPQLLSIKSRFRLNTIRIGQIIDPHKVVLPSPQLSLPHIAYVVEVLCVFGVWGLSIGKRSLFTLENAITFVMSVVKVDEVKGGVPEARVALLPFGDEAASDHVRSGHSVLHLEDRRAVHQLISMDPIVRHNINDLVLTEEALVQAQVLWQVVLPNPQTKNVDAVLDVLQETPLKVFELQVQAIHEVLHLQFLLGFCTVEGEVLNDVGRHDGLGQLFGDVVNV